MSLGPPGVCLLGLPLVPAQHTRTCGSFPKAQHISCTGALHCTWCTLTLLMSTFDVRELGEATWFLGMKIERDHSARTIKLSQPTMANDLLSKFDMVNATPKSTPLSPGVTLSKFEGDELDSTTKSAYAELIGSLMYLSTCTRPDLSQAVGALARYMSAPTSQHWQAAKGVLRYLRGTTDMGITFGGNNNGLIGYCDSDFAGDKDTRRSTTGYVFIANGGAISWSSRLQATVAASTTESEYMAAAGATKEAMWLRELMSTFCITSDSPLEIFCDNQAALSLIKNPILSQRSKHIDVIYHFTRERVARKEVQFAYCPTAIMIADCLTKAVPEQKLTTCMHGMGMH